MRTRKPSGRAQREKNLRSSRRWGKSFACTLAVLGCLSAGCRSSLPDPSAKAYSDFISTFYVGLAALQVGDDVRADRYLGKASQMVPGEPASWANWGILALRQRSFDTAAQRLDKARELAPKNDRIYYLLGLLEGDRGNSVKAIADLRQAIKLNPANLRAVYQLASEVERQGDENSDTDFEKLMQQILTIQPNNLAALLELSRISAKRGDAATLHATVEKIAAQSGAWPADVKQQLTALQAAAGGPEPKTAATRSIFLRNVLMQVPEFRASLSEIKPQPGEEAIPFTHFLRLASPDFKPASADEAMTFAAQPVANLPAEKWDWIEAISLNGSGAPTVAVANAHDVRLSTGATFSFPGGPANVTPTPEGILPVDFNYDFKTDMVLAGAGGLRFMRQDNPEAFTDITAQTKLSRPIIDGSYTGAWAVDIEADGDLDIVLGEKDGLPTALRNNGDGTFQPIHPFAGISGIRQFVWADLNGDGNPDAALIDGSGQLHVFINDRSGRFHEQDVSGFSTVKAIAVADVNRNGVLALLAVRGDGAIVSLSESEDGKSWTQAVIANVPDAANYLAHEVRLHAGDLDNNGAFDLLLSSVDSAQSALIWLQDEQGKFVQMNKPAATAKIFGAADLQGNGRLDLLEISADSAAQEGINHGTKTYHWQTIRPRARQATGDQRINSYGIGGDIEIRSGLLVQKQPISSPELHFGLGNQTEVDVARIVWPNGSVRAEFALKADQQIVTEQRLKGSCPFLFAYNGKQMEFVKDTVPWGSAIGLRINALGPARIEATQEWYKIGRNQLVPRDGYYDLRITGELWETYYYDYLSLMTVDHPAGTEIFTDERYAVPPVKLAVTAVAEPQAIARAVDDNGQDVTDILSALDGKYLDTFGRGQYQGITRDHYVEIDLGKDAPTTGPLWLVARGWLHPSDSSINIAMSQGHHEAPRPLSLEIPDGHGGWKVAKPNLGFPAGRNKVCLIDLTNVFVPGTPRKVRLRTNLEIYWDAIQWAKGLPDAQLRITRLAPATADLHYRGYSVIHQANASSPEIPDYNHLMATAQIWRDLAGYYTRYGDVRPLLAGIDDRYVIMNAGDELALRFAAPPAPPAGWVRDYVIAGDGWIKDGDYNSTDSKTVLPYPYHARTEYDTTPGKLEDDWVYQHHTNDWQTYQTRYVTPDMFDNALRSSAAK
ncbi:FG-GAP-like repeat-containing protein [Alloacidobacterium sp.]|uniref:FG-GAP-like repeat-containing protein n=1 Tax=Alloacidobacterium sp. TaxID=2951999 RepID=UPI002D5F0016|nr:FG-GAP-like repeat-containing protein [Alloacidobacterium sp.]HYK36232.1 FG-GAP-like repeat-containing protein [Alloacidobacterium sp.]